MTQLDCTVTSCIYNRDFLCGKGNITIGGREATKPGDTCCESFRERGTNTMNRVDQADTAVEIDCEACECIHNEDCKCSATHIGIGGGSGACRCKETECEDFRCRCWQETGNAADVREKLLWKIEAERCRLDELVKKGLDRPEVLRQSRKVDELLRKYYPEWCDGKR